MPDYWVDDGAGGFKQLQANDINALAKQLRGPTFTESAQDFAQSVPTGLANAGAAIPGMLGDVQAGAQWLAGDRPQSKDMVTPTLPTAVPRTTDYIKQIEQWTGPLHQPTTPAGHYGKAFGENVIGALGPGGPARRVANVAIPALVSETAGQLTKGTPVEPYARFAGGAGGGFIGTRNLPAMGGRAGAERSVAEMFDKSDLARSRELGPKSFLFEANPSLERVMSGVLQRPGDASTRAAEALINRQEGATKRLTSEYTAASEKAAEDLAGKNAPYPWASGSPVVPSEFIAKLDRDKQILGGQYAIALQNPHVKAVDLTSVATYANGLFPKLSGDMRSQMRRAIETIYPEDANGVRRLRSDPEEVLLARQSLDDQIKQLADKPNAQRIMTEFRGKLDQELSNAVPGIKVVDRQYAHLAQQDKDFAYGQRLLRSGEGATHPSDVRSYMSTIKADTLRDAITIAGPTKAAKDLADKMYVERLGAIQAGIRSDLDRISGTSIYDVTSLRRAVQTEGDWNYEKLVDVMGKTSANRILRATDREGEFQRVYNDMLKNSKTAQRMVAERMTNLMEGGSGSGSHVSTGLLVGALTGEPVSAMAASAMSAGVHQKVKDFMRAVTAGGQRRLDDALVDILMTQSPGGRGKAATETIDRLMAAKKAAPSWGRTLYGTAAGTEGGSIPMRFGQDD